MSDLKELHNPLSYPSQHQPEGTDKRMETPEERRKRKMLIDGLRKGPLVQEPAPPKKPKGEWA